MFYKFQKVAEFYPNKRRAIVRVKADKTVNFFEIAVKNKVNVMAFIVDDSERRNRTGLQPKMLHQPFVGTKAEP